MERKNDEILTDNEDKGVVRFIFINLLISLFILMVYFYLSEAFGAISSFYLSSSTFTIDIVVSIIALVFLSVLAGPIHGTIAGFFGELLIELAFYPQVDYFWCILLAILGLMSGLYRYNPESSKKLKRLYYTFFALLFACFFTSILFLIAQIIVYSNLIDLYSLFIDYGFRFFFQLLVSVLIFVPLLLIVYDRVFSFKDNDIIHDFLTHHPKTQEGIQHAFYFKFGRTRIFLCSRCSGVVLGVIFSFFFFHVVEAIYNFRISAEYAIILCSLFPIPCFIDWGSQKLLYRKSNTKYRLFTGIMVGIAVYLIQYTRIYALILLIVLVLYFSILFLLFYFGQKKAFRLYQEELEFIDESKQDDQLKIKRSER
ncbi:MAG: DUF2085 domain-containing protein [Promethearchaeota archaeon]